MAKPAAQHRIFELAITLLLIAIVATLRSAIFPAGDESIANTATPIGGWLQSLQQSIPAISAIIWGVAIMYAGLTIGRTGVRYSIYPAYTLMAIPIFGVMAAMVMTSGDFLISTLVLVLTTLAMKYIIRCIMRSESFGDLSLAMICFGVLPLVYAPATLLCFAMLVLVLLVRNTWRDLVVTLISLAFPITSICYWHWCAGEEFTEPAILIWDSMWSQSEFSFFSTLNPATILLLGVLILMALCAVSLIISDRFSLKVKSRAIMRFTALMLFVTIATLLLPSSTATSTALIAIPTATLLPLIFVRMGVGFTETLYRLMLLLAAANMVMMSL